MRLGTQEMFGVLEVKGEATDASSSDREMPLCALFRAWVKYKEWAEISQFVSVLTCCRRGKNHFQSDATYPTVVGSVSAHSHKVAVGKSRRAISLCSVSDSLTVTSSRSYGCDTSTNQQLMCVWQTVSTHSTPCSASMSWVFWSGAILANTVPCSTSYKAEQTIRNCNRKRWLSWR